MNTIPVVCCFWATVIPGISASAQGVFQNLDFEAGRVVFVGNSAYDVVATNALPGWTAFAGTNRLTAVPYNDFGILPSVGLFGSNFVAISGNFSAFLSQTDGGGSISQTGLVPTNVESLSFAAASTYFSLLVTLNGHDLSYVPVGNATNTYGEAYGIYAANVSAFAGQTATLSFLCTGGYLSLDDIQFSSSPVPEPGNLALLALGGGAFTYICARRRREINSPRQTGAIQNDPRL